MTLEDAIRYAHNNKGHIYTTDELWEDNENCIIEDSLGNLVWGSTGESITDFSELPEDGWYDATDIDEYTEDDIIPEGIRKDVYCDVLWDENDMSF